MAAYILRRLPQMALVLLLFITVVFFLLQAQPGDITTVYAVNPNVPPQAREEIRGAFGLDKPVWQQYVLYLRNFASGDLGVSFSHYPRPVMEIILERLPRTLLLFTTAAVISFYLGFVMGKAIAWRRGTLSEYGATIGGAALYTVFTPWFALLLIWLFAFRLGWFPVGKFLDPGLWRDVSVSANAVFHGMLITAAVLSAFTFIALLLLKRLRPRGAVALVPLVFAPALGITVGVWAFSGVGHLALDIVRHMVLPVLTLTLVSFAGTMLLTRSSMLETMREDFVVAARARGLSEAAVRDRHAARNALLPVVTSLVFSLAFAIDGGVITETIFSWPGMGLTLLNSVLEEDLPLAIGALVFTGIFALGAHLVADVLYAFLDPRVRYR